MSRRKSEGCFITRNNGRFEYRFFYLNEYGQKQRKSVSGGCREECLQRAEEWLQEYMESIKPFDQSSTITDILHRKFEGDYKANQIGEATLLRKRELLRIIERNVIGIIPISMVGRNEIEEFGVSIKHYSNTVIEALYQCLKTAFTIAEEESLVTKNPMKSRRFRKPKSDRKDKTINALTRDEQSRLINCLKNYEPPYGRNDFRLQLFIEMNSGMRMGEINALKPDDIDLEKKVIRVHSTVSIGTDNKPFIKEGAKTQNGNREVPISRTLEPYLREALEKQEPNKLDLLFCDRYSGKPLRTSDVSNYFNRICKRALIAPRGQHALRHTFATRCIEAGIPPVVLKQWLGHSDIHITLDTYTDIFSELNDGSVNMLDDYLNSL